MFNTYPEGREFLDELIGEFKVECLWASVSDTGLMKGKVIVLGLAADVLAVSEFLYERLRRNPKDTDTVAYVKTGAEEIILNNLQPKTIAKLIVEALNDLEIKDRPKKE